MARRGRHTGSIVPSIPAVSIIPRMKSISNSYYNASRHNGTQSSIPAEFSEVRDAPIAKRGSDYAMSVIYMDISIESVRIFNTGTKVLTVTMTYPDDDLSSTQNLFPSAVDVNNLNDVLIAIGNAFKVATDDIIDQYDTIHGPGSWAGDATKAQLYPFVDYFSGTRLFSFYNDVRNSTSGTGSGATPILMFLSPQLATLFKSIMINVSTGQVLFPILPGNVNLSTLYAPQVAGNYVNNLQTSESTELWYDIQSILLVSNNLGTRPEYIGVMSEQGTNSQLPILAAFNVAVNAGDSNPSNKIVYYPTAEYRWVDIKSDKPIQEIDLKFYYSDREGGIYPLYLAPGDGFNVKCLFSIRLI
jgi:hypothetical protein